MNNGNSPFDNKLAEIKGAKNELAKQEYRLISKALESDDPDQIIKANSYWQDVQNKVDSGFKTTLIDPNEWTQGNGFKHKRFNLDYNIMRRMVDTTPIIQSIIGTRQTQVQAFSTPQTRKYETGFVVRKKREFYSEDAPTITREDKKTIDYITKFLLNGGVADNSWHADNFDTFLSKIVADSLTLDQACFEVVRNNGGVPQEYLAVDGATIRLADTMYEEDPNVALYDINGKLTKRKRGYLPSYVQVINNQILSEYYPWELCVGMRNATTDIRANGYGKSEIERLVSIITWMLYGDTYNGKFFSQGSNPKGMLKVGAGANRNRINEFRQQWLAMVSGVQNAWKVPVIEGDVEWIDMQKGNRDMEFTQWQQYLIKVACAVYKIAPEEIGFSSKNNQSMFEGSEQVRLDYSQDKGLKPLLKSIEFWLNKWIVQAIDEDFEFKFVGIDQDDEDKEIDRLNKKVQHGMGMKEWREAIGLDRDLKDDDFPLNQIFMQNKQQEAFADQQQESGDAVDQNFDLWNTLDDEGIDKAITQDNPMMAELMR